MNIAERLKSERLKAGLSQGQVAKLTTISLRSQNNYENGSRVPDANYLAKLAEIPGIDIHYIVTGSRITDSRVIEYRELLNREVLKLAIKQVEDGLNAAKSNWDSEAKADMVLFMYDAYLGKMTCPCCSSRIHEHHLSQLSTYEDSQDKKEASTPSDSLD